MMKLPLILYIYLLVIFLLIRKHTYIRDNLHLQFIALARINFKWTLSSFSQIYFPEIIVGLII